MFHVFATRFDVTKNFENFLVFKDELNKGLNREECSFRTSGQRMHQLFAKRKAGFRLDVRWFAVHGVTGGTARTDAPYSHSLSRPVTLEVSGDDTHGMLLARQTRTAHVQRNFSLSFVRLEENFLPFHGTSFCISGTSGMGIDMTRTCVCFFLSSCLFMPFMWRYLLEFLDCHICTSNPTITYII